MRSRIGDHDEPPGNPGGFKGCQVNVALPRALLNTQVKSPLRKERLLFFRNTLHKRGGRRPLSYPNDCHPPHLFSNSGNPGPPMTCVVLGGPSFLSVAGGAGYYMLPACAWCPHGHSASFALPISLSQLFWGPQFVLIQV